MRIGAGTDGVDVQLNSAAHTVDAQLHQLTRTVTRHGHLHPAGRLHRPNVARMTTIYYERDGDVDALAGQTVAVVGYGNQGRSWALNLRDSDVDVAVCVRNDDTRKKAGADGFAAADVDAASDADVVCLVVPDDVIPGLPITFGPDALVIVASGYALAFERLQPSCDTGMVAPRMLGPEVRRCYEEGVGFIAAVGVQQDATGTARARTLAVAKAIGGLRQGARLLLVPPV